MRYIHGLIIFLFLMYSSLAWATSAENCQTLSCVRAGIDAIDQHIVVLISERLAYVKKAAELKQQDKKAVHDAAREQNILTSVSLQAQQLGYDGKIAQAIFKTILYQSNQYEKTIAKTAVQP